MAKVKIVQIAIDAPFIYYVDDIGRVWYQKANGQNVNGDSKCGWSQLDLPNEPTDI